MALFNRLTLTQRLKKEGKRSFVAPAGAETEKLYRVQGAVSDGMSTLLPHVRNVYLSVILIDASKSMGQEAVDDLATTGATTIVSQMRVRCKQDQTMTYMVMIVFFNHTIDIVAPFTDVRGEVTLRSTTACGQTRVEQAIDFAIDAIEEKKASCAKDKQRVVRSSIAILTDGNNTDENGRITPLSADFADKIKKLNDESVDTVAVGCGPSVDKAMLQIIAPAIEVKHRDGSVTSAKHAILCKDGMVDADTFKAVVAALGSASSTGSSETVSFVPLPENTKSRERDENLDYSNAVPVDLSRFEILG